MKAYRNSKGHTMMVLKDNDGDYGVYVRKSDKEDMKPTASKYPHRATRKEAEEDLVAMVYRSREKTWREVEV